ncbi:helix-turn-helix domain-containing protein [Pseudomonas sp. MDT1-16]
MSLKNEVAAAIRVIRRQREIGYGDLADVSAQANISLLEQGKTNITLDKLSKLAEALDFEPVALFTICIALQRGDSPDEVISGAMRQIEEFKAAGGMEELRAQLDGGTLSKRPRGKPTNTANAEAVKKLKAEGLTQAEAMRALELPKSTVQRYWQE